MNIEVKHSYFTTDVQNLALVAWKEARGEGIDGCCAVMHVIVNRVGHPGFAATLHDVIYGRNQFTSMSVPSDPEFNLAPNTPESGALNDYIYAQCLSVAQSMLGGYLADETKGAHYYANLHEIEQGGWFERNIVSNPEGHPVTAIIGHHTFFA